MLRQRSDKACDAQAVMAKGKAGSMLGRLADAVLLAGAIVFLTGLYYWIVKAGIPYQDPPLELQIQYAVNETIGETLLANGFWMLLCGGALRVLLWLTGRKRPEGSSARRP